MSGFLKDKSEYEKNANNAFERASKIHSRINSTIRNLFSSTDDIEEKCHEAIKNYQNASRIYLLVGNVPKAIQCLEFVAELELRINDFNYTQTLSEMADICSKHSDKRAVELYKKIIGTVIENNKYEKIGDPFLKLYEFYLVNDTVTKAIETLEECLTFEHVMHPPMVNTIKTKLATQYISNGSYQQAQQLSEELGNEHSKQQYPYKAEDHFYNALICLLAIGDSIGALNKAKIYAGTYAKFDSGRKYKFVMELIKAVDENNIDTFEVAIKDYDRISKLTELEVTVLLHVKRSVFENNDLC